MKNQGIAIIHILYALYPYCIKQIILGIRIVMTLYPCIMALWPQSCPCSNSLNLWTNFVHYVFYLRPSFLTCQKSIQFLILIDYSQSLENYILFKGTVNCCKVTEFIFTRSFSCVISQSFWWRVWQIVAAPKKSCPTIRAIWVWNQIKDSLRVC